VRVWRGVVPKEKSAEYLEYLKKTGMKDYASTPGNLGATILMRHKKKKTEFVVISRWNSFEEIRNFAGTNVDRARYYPRDKKFLLKLEPKVKHYDVAFES
jgi:heme-degrading monooxygenase HmoA